MTEVRDRRWRAVTGSLSALLIAAQMLPVLRSGLLEGFQFNSAALAIDLAAGRSPATDPLYPIDGAFFYLSRLGANDLLVLLQPLARDPLLPTRLIAAASLVAWGYATAVFLRRVANTGWATTLFLLALAQGAFYAAYYATDSLTGAAALAGALAVVAAGTSWPRTVAAAGLLGLATCFRLDSLLMAPFFAIRLWQAEGARPATFGKLAVATALAIAMPTLLFAVQGASLLDALRVSRTAVALWQRHFDIASWTVRLLVIVQPALLVLALVGVVDAGARRRWARLLLLAVPALLFVLLYGAQIYTSRQLLPVVPLAAALAADGLAVIARGWREGRRHAYIAAGATGVALALMLLPPAGKLEEGMRPVTGQLAVLGDWWCYLGALDRGTRATLAAVDAYAAREPAPVVVSSDWNGDRLAHWAILRAGFRALPGSGSAGCTRYLELFARGGRRLYHFRAHLPFVPHQAAGGQSVVDRLLPCLPAMGARGRALLFVTALPADAFAPGDAPLVAGDPTAERATGFIDLKTRRPAPLGREALILPKAWLVEADARHLAALPPVASGTPKELGAEEAQLREPMLAAP